MKSCVSVLLAGITAAMFATTALAQAPVRADRPQTKGSGAPPMNCDQAQDKARCEALNKDIEACRGKTDDEWRSCMHRPLTAKFRPPKARDCAKARNTARCEGHSLALEACKEMATRTEHRKCMSKQLQQQAPKKGL